MLKSIPLPLILSLAGALVGHAQSDDVLITPPTPPAVKAPPVLRGRLASQTYILAQKSDDDQSSQLDKALAEAQEQVAAAEKEAAEKADLAEKGAFDAANFIVRGFGEGPSMRGHNLIINTSRTNSEAITGLDEDLSIMARILDKSLNSAYHPEREAMLGIFIKGAPFYRGDQNLYIEGQGVVYVRSVKLPLAPGVATTGAPNAAAKDTAWQEAKNEVNGTMSQRFVKERREKQYAPFDPERVEKLKRDVVAALKNAVNIAGLGSEESITVVLLGPPTPETPREEEEVQRVRAVGWRDPRPTTMTIRLKKSDAKDAASGAIDLAELQKRAVISLY